LPVINRIGSPAGRRELDRVIAEQSPELIVVGEPRHLSGARGKQARRAAAFAEGLRKRVSVPVELVDERLTTVEAGRRAAEAGSSTAIDSLAACVLLEAYLAGR
jgi:putative Holliday junction resolvase